MLIIAMLLITNLIESGISKDFEFGMSVADFLSLVNWYGKKYLDDG